MSIGFHSNPNQSYPILYQLGRGTAINNHSGNQHFRTLVDAQRKNFHTAKLKADKQAIVMNIIDDIQSLQPPGRFLMEDRSDGGLKCIDNDGTIGDSSNIHPILRSKAWVVVGSDKAIDKVFHRLREKEETVSKSPISGLANESETDSHLLQELAQDINLKSHSKSTESHGDFEKCEDIASIPSSEEDETVTTIIPARNVSDLLKGEHLPNSTYLWYCPILMNCSSFLSLTGLPLWQRDCNQSTPRQPAPSVIGRAQ